MENMRYDTVVIGGGTAGAFAGIAAAATGAKTLVVEQYGYLGGILSLGMNFLGAADGEGYWALGGYPREAVSRLQNRGEATSVKLDPLFGSLLAQDPEPLKIELARMAREVGLEVLYHTQVAEVQTNARKVTSLTVANKSGLSTIEADTFVDCSGDADVVARGGGEFVFGREADALPQPVSNIFRVGEVDLDRTWTYLETHPEDRTAPKGWSGQAQSMDYIRNTPGVHIMAFHSLVKMAKENGDFTIPRYSLGLYTLPGRHDVVINFTRVHGVDGTDPQQVSNAEVELQLQTAEVLHFLRSYVPGFEKCALISMPHQVGVRESRHIVGQHVLTRNDVVAGTTFDDTVGRGAYPLDIHDVGSGEQVLNNTVGGGGITLWPIMQSYGIPRRSLIPNGLDNVTVGGRCISADHEAAGSARGQAVCMVSGHAAGTLAALGSQHGQPVWDVPISLVQNTLRSQGAVLDRDDPVPETAQPATVSAFAS